MKLPIISGKQLVKALARLGYELDHTTGSHMILRLNQHPFTRITVPNHREISKGTLRAIMRYAGLTRERLNELLND